MNFSMYCIYDSAAESYMRPFFARSHGEAMRMFGDIAVSSEHPVGVHPEHYSLFYVGDFVEKSAKFTIKKKVALANAWELAAQARQIEPGSLKSNGDLAEAVQGVLESDSPGGTD